MALELEGRLVKVLPQQTGAGKNGTWVKQDFVVETSDQYPKKICFSAWGDKAADLSRYKTGDVLKVAFNLESREYNEKWYTEARAWKIDGNVAGETQKASASAPTESTFFSDEEDNDLPF
ncbi:MAG TPA: DUF3127 domain-containing protein [Cytophagaceae bacterium]|jgi:hypothetical protein